MPKALHEATTLAEFIKILKAERGLSDKSLGNKIGVSHNTINRLVNGHRADDSTLDKIADYAGVTRAWLYELAKDIPVRPRYPRSVALLVALIEHAPPEVQEDVLAMARAMVEQQRKREKEKAQTSRKSEFAQG